VIIPVLEKNRGWFELIQTSTPLMLHEADGADRLTMVSDAWLETLGYARQDVVGSPFEIFLSVDSALDYGSIKQQLLETGQCREIPLQLLKHDGQVLDILFSAMAELEPGNQLVRSFALLSDVAEQYGAADDLRKEQSALEERVRNRATELNEAYEQLVVEMKERKRSETILRTIAQGVYATTGVAFFTSLVKFLSKALDMDHALIGLFDEQEENQVQTVAACFDGEVVENFRYDISGTPCAKAREQGLCLYPKNAKELFPDDNMLSTMTIESYVGICLNDSSGAPVGLLVVMSRNSVEATSTAVSMLQIYASRVAAKLERLKQEEELIQVRNLESLGRMAAGIAHEVNNPLTNASINIQMLRRKLGFLEDNTPVLKRVEAVERNIERASNIAKELLLFSRQRELELVPVDINEIINKSVRQINYDLERISVEKSLAELPHISGDTLKLEGLFINLLNNALDAMPQGGTLSVSTRVENGYIVAKVQDTGTGIDEADLSKVFDPFFTTKEVGKGTGLGLSIAYGVVRQHHGVIEAIGGRDGATFVIKLPVHSKEMK